MCHAAAPIRHAAAHHRSLHPFTIYILYQDTIQHSYQQLPLCCCTTSLTLVSLLSAIIFPFFPFTTAATLASLLYRIRQ